MKSYANSFFVRMHPCLSVLYLHQHRSYTISLWRAEELGALEVVQKLYFEGEPYYTEDVWDDFSMFVPMLNFIQQKVLSIYTFKKYSIMQ